MAKISFFPSLLPVIMKNKDAFELTDEQKAGFSVGGEKTTSVWLTS
jgi:hypothetical protein